MTTDVLENTIREKNRLMLNLQQAKDVGDPPKKVRELAHGAAELEHQIAGALLERDQVESAIPNLVSAARCYATAGEADNAESALRDAESRTLLLPIRKEIDGIREVVEVVQVKEGNHAAFKAVMRRNYALAVTRARNILGNQSAEVEDVAQEAFLSLWKSRGRINDPDRFTRWLATTVRNAAMGHGRLRCRLRRLQGKLVNCLGLGQGQTETPTHEDSALQKEAVNEILDMIPDKSDREVVIRFYLDESSDAEIAEELGISPDAAKHRRLRILAKLREKLR